MINTYDIEWDHYENIITNCIDDNDIKHKIIFYDKNKPFDVNYCKTNIILEIIKNYDNVELKYWKEDHLKCLFKNIKLNSTIINFLINKEININILSRNESLTCSLIKEFINHWDINEILINSKLSISDLGTIMDISKIKIELNKLNKIKNRFVENMKEQDLIKNTEKINNLSNKFIVLEKKIETVNILLENDIKNLNKLKKDHEYLDTYVELYLQNLDETKNNKNNELIDKIENLNLLKDELYILKEDVVTIKNEMNTKLVISDQKFKDKLTMITNNLKYNNKYFNYELKKYQTYINYLLFFMVLQFSILIFIIYKFFK